VISQHPKVTDEMLMALADNELAPADAAAARDAIATDPALARRFATFAETRGVLGRVHADALSEPVPARQRHDTRPFLDAWRVGRGNGRQQPRHASRKGRVSCRWRAARARLGSPWRWPPRSRSRWAAWSGSRLPGLPARCRRPALTCWAPPRRS
jgi:anti-sigma factor RsiW